MSASAHTFIDDTDIIECIPLTEKAWHVLYDITLDNQKFGDDANDIAIGVELCYSPSGKFDSKKAYEKYVWYLAYLCDKYKINPKTHIIGHEHLDPGRKSDPTNALRTIGKTFAQLITDVSTVLAGTPTSTPTTTPPKAEAAPTPIGEIEVVVDSLNVRKKAGLGGDIVKTITKGQKYKTYFVSNGWYNLGGEQFCSGGAAYVKFTPYGKTPSKQALPNVLLRKGDKGENVRLLQEALVSVKFYPNKQLKNYGVDGVFGSDTENALKRFQMVYLPYEVNGVYSDKVRAKFVPLLK